jgi:hypothetical protein
MGASSFPLESKLEDLIRSDPTILGEPLLLIGRQVPTEYGKFIDLLAVGAEETLHILDPRWSAGYPGSCGKQPSDASSASDEIGATRLVGSRIRGGPLLVLLC